jgi:Phytanoyl-CoA dioxygenase (PhyH)
VNIARIQNEIWTDGFAVCEGVVSPQAIDELLEALNGIGPGDSGHRRGGIRNLLEASPQVRALANSPNVAHFVEGVLGPGAFPVRGILFDKVPEANWKVPWHQDVTIAVHERVEAEGFGPWTVKADVLHVQPPTAILEGMLSVRLHLDDCGEENGALRVIPGSHRKGRIAEEEIPSIRASSREHICAVARGDALLMRPLLLHASSASRLPGHRRVIHLDFASVQLPSPMKWFSEVS